jgi:hypothetical protein
VTDDEREQVLAECLAEYHSRRALGENPRVEELRERAGEAYGDLVAVIAAEARFDEAIEPRSSAHFPRIFGEFTLLGELGRGAIGVVYEALHRPLGRDVALKVLRTGFDTDETARERFRREARACAAVRHPNIVEIFDAGTYEDQAWYSMALVRGKSLHAAARAGALPPPREFARGVAGIADALQALHAAGIVHRDVKPSNIVVADGPPDGGRMMLADFGLARTAATERLTRTGEPVGTPLYMSPEQMTAGASEVDGRSDVYALGATLYEVLAGKPMFAADDAAQILRMILNERPRPLREVAPHVDPELARIVMKAIERRRDDRYESAAAMRDDLLAFADGRHVVGRPVSPVVHTLRRTARLWPVAAAVAAAAGGVAWWATHRPAVLLVQTVPPSEVLVDGRALGTTPVRLDLSPGKYALGLRTEGFAAHEERIDLRPGETRDLRHVMRIEDPDDPAAVRRLLDALGVKAQALQPYSLQRTAASGRATPLLPRGEVGADDAASFRIEVDEDFRAKGVLRFARGAEILYEEAFDPRRLDTQGALPPGVVSALRAGDRVTWGFFPATGAPSTAEFTVVAATSGARLAALEDRLRGQPAAARGLVRAHALLADGLATAAFREASAVAAERPQSAEARRLMLEALRRLGLPATSLANQTQRALDRIPASRGGGLPDSK